MENLPLLAAISAASLRPCSEYEPPQLAGLAWSFAALAVTSDRPLVDAISSQALATIGFVGRRELGVLVDACFADHSAFLPLLGLAAAETMSALENGCLDLVDGGGSPGAVGSLGAVGTQMLLQRAGIAAAVGVEPGHSRALASALRGAPRPGPGTVLCLAAYRLSSGGRPAVAGTVLRRNRGASPGASPPVGAAPTLLQAVQLPGRRPVDRQACAEFRALSELAAGIAGLGGGLGAPTTGSVRLHVTEPPCLSCLGALLQFSRAHPGVDLSVSLDSALLRYSGAAPRGGGAATRGTDAPEEGRNGAPVAGG